MDNKPNPAAFTVVSCVPLGRGVYLLTTESKKYGRVTQRVLMFPPSFFKENR